MAKEVLIAPVEDKAVRLLDRSTAQGGLCRGAPTQPVARPHRPPATRAIDTSLGGTFLHWWSAPSGRTVRSGLAYVSRLKGWMAPFGGVASKYLPDYLGWCRMIERDGERLTPHHLIAQAASA